MRAAERFSALARRDGQPVVLHCTGGSTREGWGFLQPFLTESKDYLWQQSSPLGRYEGSRYRFYGEADLAEAQEEFDYLTAMGRNYEVREALPVYLGQSLMYWWAVLVPKDEEEECP
jgi:hypothetical protein